MGKKYIVLAVDPGTSNLGTVTITLNGKLEIIKISTFLIDASKVTSTVLGIDNLTARLMFISRMFRKLISNNVDIVGLESGFSYGLRPTAIIPLSKLLGIIQYNIATKGCKMVLYTPKELKRIIGDDGTLDKDGVKQAVLNNKELKKHLTKDMISKMSEHEFDALACGYATVIGLRAHPETLVRY